MKCPYCGSCNTKVIDSRPSEDGESIRRRRECLDCERRFTTYECIEMSPILVIKRDGSREQFDVTKIKRGIVKSCEKCHVSMQEIDNVVDKINKEVANSLEQEIFSSEIGEMVMRELKDLNEVAYVRFASVYREFTDISSFLNELKKMMEDKNNS